MTTQREPGAMGIDEEIEARERALRNLVEERIQAAMQAGAFDNLPGKGRPLQLNENPFVPQELRLAYKVLADANYAPDWIELDKKVRTLREQSEALQQDHIAWLRRRAERDTPTPASKESQAANLGFDRPNKTVLARHRRVRLELVKRLHEINRHIDELNLIVPQLSLQRPRVKVANVLDDFDAACREVYPGLER